MKYNRLIKALEIGNISLKNRTIFPPISTNFAKGNGHLTNRFISHWNSKNSEGVD